MPFTRSQQKRINALAARVKALRIEREMTQKELAFACDKEPQSIQRLEAGNVNPSYLYLLQICEGLKISITDLLQGLPD